MIIITGAAGFIASCLVTELNNRGYKDLVLVDDFSKSEKKNNYSDKTFTKLIDRNEFDYWLDRNHKLVQLIFHIGARTDTTEFNFEILEKLNLEYSKLIWRKSYEYGLPLIYASSAATYGAGEFGFDDNTSPELLKPLNPYGISKNEFDKWALNNEKKPYFWAGFKFFNVYGPNEYHKGRMASVVYHAYNQIKETKKLKLFKSHNPKFEDGMQLRDFIYVKDVCSVLIHFMETRKNSGIYNLGTGKARSFLDLGKACFNALSIEPNIEFVDIPLDIRDKYQYFTQANVEKLRSVGYDKPFYSIEEGVNDYISNYLKEEKYF
ncbi:MAG TPA: ADP-glyceromanno-heptose 6-epimerase [Bacteroidales bacterium]|jgi:ADP-L-glycero-D-manno-heptose 6-epimerase|nr:ADP-glyceromanno-heptose 6-epimerase [Bacteroidales bacterium]OQC45866.1 MAG: ADP-L-glycero-D-manno-heptose-6-epimerase [Bacteroidetes bacterium ADurb.Bin028]NLP21192.1 ADP-glyceromanno-heptose 6-epimerase [Bacteroidales bacterium]HNY44425.1 ADP-glyceromanno-heptose 6-epimerase [Bacteroidales bacterium]HOD88425.1 ADP-glyceromanno-heptose 6-epimerase [Bacteroidales bacterium]